MTSKGASMLFDNLKRCNSTISKIDISRNQLDDDSMTSLGEYIEENQHLEKLILKENIITDKGIASLAEHLVGNTTLKILDFTNNRDISNESGLILLDVAKKSCLNEILFFYTSITDDIKSRIEEALKIPIDQREIPIISNSKSAAKSQSPSSST